MENLKTRPSLALFAGILWSVLDSSRLTIVLTGSSGYLGGRVKKALEEADFQVFPIDSMDSQNPLNLADTNAISNLKLPDHYLLIHLAFPLPGTMKRDKFELLISSMNENLTMRFRPERTLLISSTAVYGLDGGSNPTIRPWEVYGRLKHLTETTLMKHFRNVTIFRPGTLIEVGRISSIASYIRWLRKFPFALIPGSGGMHHPFTSTQDLINAIEYWARTDDAPKGIFDLVGRDPLTFSQIFLSQNRKGLRFAFSMPSWLLRRIGSDRFPILGISNWHFSALTYDLQFTNGNVYSSNFRTYSEMLNDI